MNEEFTYDPFANPVTYPKVGAYSGGEAGARVAKARDHCLNIYEHEGEVRIVASYSGGEGYNGLNGIMALPLKTAREFLQKALDSLPKFETVQVTIRTLRDDAGDLWFETASGNWVVDPPSQEAYENRASGVPLEYIVDHYGVQRGFSTQELTIEVR